VKSAQPLDNIIPDVFPSEKMPNQPAARPKAAMWKYSQSLTEQVVRDVEDAMMDYIGEDTPTDASAHATARDRRRLSPGQDEPTTAETYGTFADISEEQYAEENKRWVASGSVGLPPLNIQQRNAGRPNVDYFIMLKKWMTDAHVQRDLRRSPATPPAAHSAIDVHPCRTRCRQKRTG